MFVTQRAQLRTWWRRLTGRENTLAQALDLELIWIDRALTLIGDTNPEAAMRAARNVKSRLERGDQPGPAMAEDVIDILVYELDREHRRLFGEPLKVERPR